ncbi:MAG: DNA polymerase III subunit gamma/tau, partial [Actinomycetota bacterium]
MATQSLYRRYRPRRFDELRGQDHVVKALRTSVAEGREGQAYLFSGPRGTGKTTSARILAKVLNCERPEGGEPCCECDSCLAVEQGTSYDVHELDAASNNGVDAMRDLIEKSALGTPGRHKVYILDEVHMLSKGAEAALLKTLEEPPPHVVFVLATTDPQKMSDTIRSRTQHLQFHLLPVDTLQDHVRWVAADAGLDVSDAAVEQVLAQGAGSARDTLSALELVANAGGDAAEVIALDEFVEAMIEHDPGRALTMVATAISRGRDPRTLTEELIGYLRNGFLSLMAAELVQLPASRVEALTEQSRRLGPAGLVRAIEQLGGALTEMRHAPDPRVLLDVAIVQLTSEQASSDLGAIVDRLDRLERRIAEGAPASPAGPAGPSASPASPSAAAAASADPAPSDPATGRKALGGRARKVADEPTGSAPAAAGSAPAATESVPAAVAVVAGVSGSGATGSEPAESGRASVPAAADHATPAAHAVEPDEAAPAPTASAPAAPTAGGAPSAADWEQARASLRGMARAVFSPAEFDPGTLLDVTGPPARS